MIKLKQIFKKSTYVVAILALAIVPLVQTTQAAAAQITGRKAVLGSSAASASTTYAVTFTVPTTATIVKSVSVVPCTTASGACTTPSGWSGTSVTSSQPSSAGLGDSTGWTTTDSTATQLRLSKTANATTPTAATPVTVTFSAVTNPSATNTTFYLRISTYSDATWTTSIDTGTVAVSTAGQITVNATVDETLTFTLAASTVTLSPSSITTTVASTGTSTMTASTNATNGYSITYQAPNSLQPVGGTPLPSYANSTSSPGTAGFGINLVSNTTPAVGSSVSGAGTGTAAAGYNTANQYSFVAASPTQIASVAVPSNTNTYTVSYVANISPITPAGAYSTVFTYVATPNF
jgi:hypothetical protein